MLGRSNKIRAADVSVASDFHHFDDQEENSTNRAIRDVFSSIGKQGHVCCLCCCDTRRATIIMNCISVLFCCLGIAGVYLASHDIIPVDAWINAAQEVAWQDLDDDYLQTDVHFLVDHLAWAVYTFLGVCVVFAMVGIVGAVSYRPKLVISCAMWYLIQGICSLVLWGFGGLGIVLAGIWVYPNIMLYQEQVEGIMTHDNYDNEVHCCCFYPRIRTMHPVLSEDSTMSAAMGKNCRLGVYA